MNIKLSPELAAVSANAERQERKWHEAERAQRQTERIQTPSPVKVDGEYDVTITKTSNRGDGIALVEGLIVFVPGAEQGWQGKVKVTRVFERAATATKVVVRAPMPEKGEEYDITITGSGRDESGITRINGVVTFVKGAPEGWQGKVRVTGIGKSGRVIFAERTDMPSPPRQRTRVSYGLLGEEGTKKKRDASREKTRAYKTKRIHERPARLLNQSLVLDNQFCAVCKAQTVAMKDVNGNIVTTQEELAAARELGPVMRVKIAHEGSHSPLLSFPVPPAPKPASTTKTSKLPKPQVQVKKTKPYKQPNPSFSITEPSFAVRGGYFNTQENKISDVPPRFVPYGDNAVLTTIANRPGSTIADIVAATDLSVAEVKQELTSLGYKLDITRKGRHFVRGQNDIRAKVVTALPAKPVTPQRPLTEELQNVATFKVGKHVLSDEAYTIFMDSVVNKNALAQFVNQDAESKKHTLADLGFISFAEAYGATNEIHLTPIVTNGSRGSLYYYPVGGNTHSKCFLKSTKKCFHLRIITTNGRLPQTKHAMIDDYGFYKQAYVPVDGGDTIHYIDGEFRNGKPTITSYNAFVFTDFRDGKLIATRDTESNPARVIDNLVKLGAAQGMLTPYAPMKGHYYAAIWQPMNRVEQAQTVVAGSPQASPGSTGRN
ncbi:MAG: TRAM domain-containing protein [Nitrososphaerota archaeon]|nr:TRAM domain-containing protein [Nitrososphaerota archaeon]